MKIAKSTCCTRTRVLASFAVALGLLVGCDLRPSADPLRSSTASPTQASSTSGTAAASASASGSPTSPMAHAAVAEPRKVSPTNQPGFANRDPADDLLEGPPEIIPDCEARLESAHVKFRVASLPIVKKKGLTCGAPQVVQYLHGPTKLRIQPSPLVTCNLALALARFEAVANRTAKEVLGSEIVSVTQGGTYNCRSMARFKIISEHSFANAIDIFAFTLANGRTIPVLRYFGDPKQPATTPEGRFLRLLANRLFDENVCSVVVTRFYDELHRDHIHCDMARYNVDGSR